MSSNHPFPAAELSEITSLNALDLTVESLEQRLELSYAWISPQPDDGCTCHCTGNNNCNFCGGCGPQCQPDCGTDCGCYSDNNCTTNVCIGLNCREESDDS